MPTGYTADIKDGISFEQFVMNCANAFGACISMRDLPSDTPVPGEFEPSSYHAEQLTAARFRLAFYENMPKADAVVTCMFEYDNAEAARKQHLQENLNTLESYRGMLSRVRTWPAPSKEHEGLKEFMIEQIVASIESDDYQKYLT